MTEDQTIRIFCRVRPTKAKTGMYEIGENANGVPQIQFLVPKSESDGFVNNKPEIYRFAFNRVFDAKTSQDQVFDGVAKEVVENVLAGYNGTIFAYGQTGSGKTFTITGGAEKYADRGLIPRALSYIFQYQQMHPEDTYAVQISYLEIYNERGFDLLHPQHETSKLEDLPRVHLMEDAERTVHLKNLSFHQANNEEEALNLLFLGDTNRMIAETPMNQASTRSHCIFTVHVSVRPSGSTTLKKAKLHLVDLAGSERVSKTGVGGTLLAEAKYINLSLHCLEQVILALSEKGRQHIPYRNSMMTFVLRDSLGGNCKTTMIATCSVEKRNVDETISSCRFAQRVAKVQNKAVLNEEEDPQLMIDRLKGQVRRLREELELATGEERTEALTEEEEQQCQSLVTNYVGDSDPEAALAVGADLRKVHVCFRLLKQLVLKRTVATETSSPSRPASQTSSGVAVSSASEEEIKKLKALMQQRDSEINVLVSMLKKEKRRNAVYGASLKKAGLEVPEPSYDPNELVTDRPVDASEILRDASNGSFERTSSKTLESRPSTSSGRHRARHHEVLSQAELSQARQEAFDSFRRDYAQNAAIDENKQALRQRYGDAKQLGEQVNKSRGLMNSIKSQIEQIRVSHAVQGLTEENQESVDPREEELRGQLEREKARFKTLVSNLRSLKTEIEHLQHLLEKSKVKMQKDFEIWWAEQGSLPPAVSTPVQQAVKLAWKTPPVTPSQGQIAATASMPYNSATNGNTSSFSRKRNTKTHDSRPNSRSSSSSVQLTGDSRADADILAFVKARQSLLDRGQRKH